jgi:minor extracellular serine protease Vpr
MNLRTQPFDANTRRALEQKLVQEQMHVPVHTSIHTSMHVLPNRFSLMRFVLMCLFTISAFFALPKAAVLAQPNPHSTNIPQDSSFIQSAKLSPALRIELAERMHKSRSKSLDLDSQRLPVFINFATSAPNLANLPASFAGRILPNGIASGYILPSDIESLVQNPLVLRIEGASYLYPLNNNANIRTRVDEVHASSMLPEGNKGQGVIVGVIDTGIDFSHPDFSNANGTRILYLLDMQENGLNVEWTKSQIDNFPLLITQRDGLSGGGHGTHVTGTAAGNGSLNPLYPGVAPKSHIIAVKGTRDPDGGGGFADVDVVDAVAYIFEKADALGRPAVVNLSIGGHFGPHDGTSLFEQGLQSLQGPGRVIVTAAGNSGLTPVHAGTTLLPDRTYALPINTPSDRAIIDAWFDAGSIHSIRLNVYKATNDGLQNVTVTSPINSGDIVGVDTNGNLDPVAVIHNGDTLGYFVADLTNTVDLGNDDGNFVLLLTNDGISDINLSKYVWVVEMLTAGADGGRFDAWAVRGRFWPFFRGVTNGTEIRGDFDFTVTIPGTTKEIITVAAFNSSDRWTDIDGNLQIQQEPREGLSGGFPATIDSIAYFSGRGPTRDGRPKPDIAGPGLRLISSLSSHFSISDGSSEGLTRRLVAEGGGYQSMQGTSMSAPHVAGIVALMLQIDPTLGYHEIMSLFAAHSQPADQKTGPLPNLRYGYGRIDAFELVSALLTVNSIDTDPSDMPASIRLAQNYPNPFNPTTLISFEIAGAAAGEPISLRVFDIIGREVAVLVDEAKSNGLHTVRFDAAGLAAGMYVYRLETSNATETRKMVLLK